MLLVIDIGNTNIKLGIYKGNELAMSWRLSVKTPRTSDEFGVKMRSLFSLEGVKFEDITGIVMSSVSPEHNYTIERACTFYIKIKPMIVGPGIKTGINPKYLNPHELGSDRIVNSVAAYKLYGGPCVVVDFGTATTFNYVTASGEFLGGAIAPGIKSSMESLVENASLLTRVELQKPKTAIGRTTATNIQAGTVLGFTGLVKYIIDRMKKERGEPITTIATGGLAELVVAEDPQLFNVLDRSLTLKGLKIIYDLNSTLT
jgi:type III pantothenate kinase